MTIVLTIDVTADDISCGQRQSPFNDPIAIAVRRTTRTEGVVLVDPKYIFVEDAGLAFEANTPDQVARFIERFDADLTVAPFEFTLTLEEV